MALPMGQQAEDCVTSYKQNEQRPPREARRMSERRRRRRRQKEDGHFATSLLYLREAGGQVRAARA